MYQWLLKAICETKPLTKPERNPRESELGVIELDGEGPLVGDNDATWEAIWFAY